MIKLNNGYEILTKSGTFDLYRTKTVVNKETKEEKQVKEVVGYYIEFKGALNAYINNVLLDKSNENDFDLEDVKNILNELKEEIKLYGN